MEKAQINFLRIEPAKNGAVVTYEEKKLKNSKESDKNCFENCSYKSCTEAFEAKDGESIDECLDRAMDRFTVLWKQSHAGKY